jgi:hypothetical protein
MLQSNIHTMAAGGNKCNVPRQLIQMLSATTVKRVHVYNLQLI